ncbi:uncharacterized protein [Typha angustifolia]|uniref:uncharacterized protein n=1 Tax=Typha angustifolia TaxID=59011 RepID=UPI003C2BDEB8
MAEDAQVKTLSLAEQWSLPEKEEQPSNSEVSVGETIEDKKPGDTTPEEVLSKENNETNTVPEEVVTKENNETDATPDEVVTKENDETDTTPEEVVTKENNESDATPEEVVAKENDETPVADETIPAVEENSQTSEQDDSEEKPEIKIETAPADFRFPTTNQTRHCFTRYIEYHRCVAAKGEGAAECEKFGKYYRSLCPSEWIERWNEQRENGTFPGPL